MRRFIPVWVALSVMFPLLAQAKHPFAFEDMMALKRLGEPVPSPDGKWVLFSAVDVDLAANARVNHVWIVPSAGGEARPIIKDQDADRPRWAPDGKRFAFVSSKAGGSQIWIADFDGASGAVSGVHKLTSVATEAQGELWSPDGKNILFVSNVYADCTDEACNQQKLEQSKQSKVKAMLFTHLLYRHWNSYKEGRRSHLLVVPAEGGRSRDLTPGDYDAPVFSLGGQDNYAFSPDGQEVCYTSNHDEVEATSTNNDLFVVSVNGGPSKKIVDNPASDSTPLYSPDGRYIAYRAQARPGYESDRFRLMLYERTTGKKRGLTDNFDRWVGAFAWAPDSKYIYFTAENAGEAPIYEVAVDGRMGLPREVVGGYDDDLTVTDGGHVVMFTRMSIASPSAIYRADTAMPRPGCKDDRFGLKRSPAGYVSPPCALSDALPLTHVNDAVLSQVAMSALEPFWFTGSENAKVEGFLIKPPTFDPQDKYPMKFLIHGGPQGAWGDDWSYRWNAELLAASGYVVIMINPRGSTGYGQRFIDEVNADWGGHAFQDLMLGLDYAEKTYPFIDKERECALGASFGGYMINWILGHSHRFKCLVSHDGLFNTTSAWGTTEELWFNEWEFKGTPYSNRALYDNWSPHLSAMNFKTPTLVIHGQQDYRLDVSEGFQLFTTLQRLGVPSKMLYFPDEGHWVLKPQNSQLWYRTVNDWVDQWVKK